MRHIASILLPLILFVAPTAARADAIFKTQNIMAAMRGDIGRSLLDVSVEMINESPMVAEKITPEGASFFSSNTLKTVGQNVDDLRGVHRLVVAMTTCPGGSSLAGKIENIIVWEDIAADQQGQFALGMQQMLESMNNPPAVQAPSAMRAPQTAGFHGVVFDYTKGDIKEQFSLLNEDGVKAPLKLRWSVTNSAICPGR